MKIALGLLMLFTLPILVLAATERGIGPDSSGHRYSISGLGTPPKSPSYADLWNPVLRMRKIPVIIPVLKSVARLDAENENTPPSVRYQVLGNLRYGFFQTEEFLALAYEFWVRNSQKEVSLIFYNHDGKEEAITGTLVNFAENSTYMDPEFTIRIQTKPGQYFDRPISMRFLKFADFVPKVFPEFCRFSVGELAKGDQRSLKVAN